MSTRARHQQADGEPAEHQGLAPPGVGGDRLAEHAQGVKRGAPGDDLREAQGHHGMRGGVARKGAPCRRERQPCLVSACPALFLERDRS